MARMASVGAGNVGRSWAVVFARAGWDVALWDPFEAARESAMTLIEASCRDLQAAGLLEDVEATLGRVRMAASLQDAVADVEWVQESASENTTIKQALFAELDALSPPDAVIASSTSAIPGSAFMEGMAGRARALVAHPVNPPHLIPLVEICPTPWTSADTVATAVKVMREVRQSPVTLTREVPGFLLNRLQWALMYEALHLIGEGYCQPEDIEAAVVDGLALRWAFIGPLEVGHLNATQGFAGYASGLAEAMQRVQQSLRTDYSPSAETLAGIHDALAERTPVSDIASAQLWRDKRIAALRKHLAEAEADIPRQG